MSNHSGTVDGYISFLCLLAERAHLLHQAFLPQGEEKKSEEETLQPCHILPSGEGMKDDEGWSGSHLE